MSRTHNFVLQQWLAGLSVALLTSLSGFMGGWSSPTVSKLTSLGSPIPISPADVSWVGSLIHVGRIFGAIFGAVLANSVGSKRTISVTLWPIAVGWLLVILADSVEWLYASRVLEGLGLGMTYSVFPLYVAEISLPEIRGALMSLSMVGLLVGQVIASACSAHFEIKVAAAIYLSVSLILMLVFFWLPESPHHLIKIGDYKAAREAIYWYRDGKDVTEEFAAVDKFVSGNKEKSFTSKLKNFKSPAVRKMTYLTIVLFMLVQLCGLSSILVYAEIILKQVKFTLVEPSLVVICINIFAIIVTSISMAVIDNYGRKFLLVVSSAGTCISMFSLSGYFFVSNKISVPWIPVVSILFFITSIYAGVIPVPRTILGEIFPAEIKYFATIAANITAAAFAFLAAKMYQPMVDFVGKEYVFLTYAVCASSIIPFTLLVIPETKGKSLQEIQNQLSRTKISVSKV